MNFLKSLFTDSDKIYYFDNNATTLIYDDEIKEIINKWISCGNPSNNLHILGQQAKKQLDYCRKIVADDLSVDDDEIYFTGSATEANNIIIQGIINKYIKKSGGIIDKITIMCSEFEHPSVLNVFKAYENNSYVDVVYIPIDKDVDSNYYGSVNPYHFENLINQYDNIALISIMYANNETGSINDINKIGYFINEKNKRTEDKKIFFHCDCTQVIGKKIIKPKKLYIDSLTFSGHKFHAPKGIGCLYVNNSGKKCPICGICFGGEQEETLRPGTENIAFISALSYALISAHYKREEKNLILETLKRYLMKELLKLNCRIIKPKISLSNTIMIILPKLKICNRQFCHNISKYYNVCLGTSSACQTKTESHVLNAFNINEKDKKRIIRISMSDYTTKEECEYLIKAFTELLKEYKV